jgi:hypothetical protein
MASPNPGNVGLGAPFGIAFAYANADASACVNGSAIARGVPASLPTVNTLRLGGDDSGLYMVGGHLRSWAYYPTRLNDAQLRQLSLQPPPPIVLPVRALEMADG